jgi:hypothetical protein
MTNLPFIPVLGPFGSDQLIVTLSAVHAEGRTMFGYHRRHGNLPGVVFRDESQYHAGQPYGESF